METRLSAYGEHPPLLDGRLEPSRVLFMGRGKSAVGWYRCYLPAQFLGADWVGIVGAPPHIKFETGVVGGRTAVPDLKAGGYRVVVIQQPHGTKWLRSIKVLQERGMTVLFEIDDYIHAIRKMPDHDFADGFNEDHLREIEMCMRACDGLIASTEFIARRYRAFNRRVFVCENGVDMRRYDLTLPERTTVTIGWAGGTGHARAIAEWLPAVRNVMHRHGHVNFVSVGMPWADVLAPEFGHRTLSVPFAALESYPAAMCLMDIALAPAGRGNFFKGKSDLRWVEAGALGIPVIADPSVYPKIEPGVTGFHAETPAELEQQLELLVDDRSLRLEVGATTRDYMRQERDIATTARQWEKVFGAFVD